MDTERKIIHAFVNGWLGSAAARSALRAIGSTPEAATARLRDAWIRPTRNRQPAEE